jgi:hypothetical protein
MVKDKIFVLLVLVSQLMLSCGAKEEPSSSEVESQEMGIVEEGDPYVAFDYLLKLTINRNKDQVKKLLQLPTDALIISDDKVGLDVQFEKFNLTHHITVGFFGYDVAQDFEVYISGSDASSLDFARNSLKAHLIEFYGLPFDEMNHPNGLSVSTWMIDLFETGKENVIFSLSLQDGTLSYTCAMLNDEL